MAGSMLIYWRVYQITSIYVITIYCVFRFEPFRRAFAEDPTPPSWRNESYATYSSSKHSRLLGMEFAWGALWFNVCRSHRIHGAAILMVTWIPSIYPSHVSMGCHYCEQVDTIQTQIPNWRHEDLTHLCFKTKSTRIYQDISFILV